MDFSRLAVRLERKIRVCWLDPAPNHPLGEVSQVYYCPNKGAGQGGAHRQLPCAFRWTKTPSIAVNSEQDDCQKVVRPLAEQLQDANCGQTRRSFHGLARRSVRG